MIYNLWKHKWRTKMIAEKGIDCKGRYYQRIETGKANDFTGKQNDRLTVLWRVKILNHDYGKKYFGYVNVIAVI